VRNEVFSFGEIYKMWELLVAVKEELHTLDPRFVWLVHEAPAHSSGSARNGILLWCDVCNWLGVDV
jgi:hypothetical protein